MIQNSNPKIFPSSSSYQCIDFYFTGFCGHSIKRPVSRAPVSVRLPADALEDRSCTSEGSLLRVFSFAESP